jgi:putative transposase
VPDEGLHITKRKLPHWQLAGSTYFVTFTLLTGRLTLAERSLLLEHIRSKDGEFYSLAAATVMEEHAHVILTPNDGIALDRITKGMKGASARTINKARGTSGALWLAESCDRIIRNQEEMDQKLRYMLNNAPKKGLVEDGYEYRWWYFNEEWLREGRGEQVS